MAQGADDHLVTPDGVRKPGVDNGKASDSFDGVEQIETPGDRQPAQRQGEEQRKQQRQPEDRN
ncbi:hypothetical protein D3C85_1748850 [compost metagenome]